MQSLPHAFQRALLAVEARGQKEFDMMHKELLVALEITCAKCGGQATAYPMPWPGKVYCPRCSPAWLESFLKFCLQRELEAEP